MLRYKDGLTYEEIGEKHGGLTRERIRQIIALTLRHIRHPGRNRIILMGREAYLKSIFAANEERKRKYNERIAELEEIIRKQNEEIAAYPDKPDNMEKQGFPVYKISNTISIDVLDLSVRSRNGLVRAGIETIQDLINYDDLFKLRNLGKVSMSEIYHKLKAFILNPYQAILP
jgi:predicted nuclease with TOPRIM domain